MSTEFKITFRGDFVEAIAPSDKSIEIVTPMWEALAAECEQRRCFNILGISTADYPMPTIDGYQHAELFNKLGIDHRYRIAWVEKNPEAVDATYFVETVLINRGLPGRLFISVGDAKAWLLNKDPQQETT